MKRIYITAIPLDSNFAIAPYAAQAANYQQTYTAPSCYPITPIIADTARPGDVADPWYTGDFSTTWRDVAEGCRGLLKAITSQAM